MSTAMRNCFLDQNSEHCKHDPFKSDIYSLGLVFLELCVVGHEDLNIVRKNFNNEAQIKKYS